MLFAYDPDQEEIEVHINDFCTNLNRQSQRLALHQKLSKVHEVDSGDYENRDIGIMISKQLVLANHGIFRTSIDLNSNEFKFIFTMRATLVSNEAPKPEIFRNFRNPKTMHKPLKEEDKGLLIGTAADKLDHSIEVVSPTDIKIIDERP